MKTPDIQFPEYGCDGDYAGARRARRSFRLCVITIVLFALILWFSEHYLRYEQTETLYIRALTLEPESARVLLLQAIKLDKEKNEFPTPKYVEALAARAEDEDALEFYAEAYALAPNSPFLGIRYGCRLFNLGYPDRALECLDESAKYPPKNALPMYLKASIMPWTNNGAELDESLALVARTNNSNEQIVFPVPHWFKELPQNGEWYSQLRRQIVDESCASIYKYVQYVIEMSNKDIAQGNYQYWDSRLETLQIMGERFVTSSEKGSVQAIAGIQVQINCIEQRRRIHEITKQPANSELSERLSILKLALKQLNEFESARANTINLDKYGHVYPLRLCWQTFLFIFALYLIVCIIGKLFHTGKVGCTLQQSLVARFALWGGILLLLLLLYVQVVMQNSSSIYSTAFKFFGYAWWSNISLLTVIGFLAPLHLLWNANEVINNVTHLELSQDDLLVAARKCGRKAYVSFLRRYFGVLAGLYLCVLSIWVVSYRILISLYPWQIKLLATGLYDTELDAVKHAIELLSWIS